ncbi:MAG TPA: hypothetical protein VMU60_13155 [Syntrophobacteria bacterium]|nr:hypothetical protein [Syntrophobacteria bacterium]
MASKILLVNFEETDADRLQKLGLEVDRGHYSNAVEFQKTGTLSTEKIYSFLPDSIEKYKIIVVNLNYSTVVETEFRQKRQILDKAFRTDFNKYWNDVGIVIVFYGDYNYDGLSTLGIFHVRFAECTRESTQLHCLVNEGTPFRKALIELRTQFLPGVKAIALRENAISGQNWEIRRIYEDSKNSLSGCYYSKTTNPQEDFPRFILLPQAKDAVAVVERLLREIVKIYPGHLPELEAPTWKEDGSYCPKQLLEYDRKLLEYKKKLEEVIKELAKRKTEARQDFETLKSILHVVDAELRTKVIAILRRLWSFDIVEMNQNEHKELHNDILIEHGPRRILACIHGTRTPNPSPKLITQVWQHLHHSGFGKGVEPALIVNHDADSDPKSRTAAYAQGYEELLDGIIFIDTRALFNLTVGVIDQLVTLDEAKEILLRKGRVGFSLEK